MPTYFPVLTIGTGESLPTLFKLNAECCITIATYNIHLVLSPPKFGQAMYCMIHT